VRPIIKRIPSRACERANASSTANNGQTMASLNANSVFYNLTTISRCCSAGSA
jgi:hypothetical protein